MKGAAETIIQEQIQAIDPLIKKKLTNALLVYFLDENYKLGLGIKEHQINDLCKILLSGNEGTPDSFNTWQVNEQNILEEYHKKELEIMDYLHLVTFEIRKQLGQYATPRSIVRYILKSVGYTPSKDIFDEKLIDPACGSGAFLVEASRIYLNALKRSNIPLCKWYPMLSGSIIGIDIDFNACFFARLNLSTLLAPSILEFVSKNGIEKLKPLPVYCADTLQLLASERENRPLFYGKPHIRLESCFDFVVGNPPYFKIKNMGQKIKDAFSESIYGHPNAYALFIQAGIEMLSTKGELGFIVPRSMLSGLYFKNLRAFVEREVAVKKIVYLSDRKKVFDNVLHGTMILSLKRKKHIEEKINISFIQSLKDMEDTNTAITVDRDKIIQRLNGTTVWFVADSPKIYNIINRIIKEHPLLSGHEINCQAKTGQVVWNRVKPLLSINGKPDTLPLVWATDVGKFCFSFNKMGTSRPCFLKIASKTESLSMKGSAILVQRITADEQPSRIVACIPEEFCNKENDGYFVENHLNIIQPMSENSKIDLYFILGVLNSEIVEFFFRAMNGNTQVSATELNLLPIPIGKYTLDIGKVAKVVQPVNGNKKKKLLAELNELVAKAYGLSEKEIEFIKRYHDKKYKRRSDDNSRD